jgi:hypothetical protein
LATLDPRAPRRELATAAGFLPVLLWALALVGMIWADATWAERLGGLGKFHRFLVIPLLLMQFRRSDHGIRVVYGFLASTVVLLLVSWGLVLIPGLPWRGKVDVGVPLKDYLAQTASFMLCAFALLGSAGEAVRAQRWRAACGLAALTLLFLGNIFFVVTSRTGLLVAPVLLLAVGWREFRWRGLLGAALLGVVVSGGLWLSSPYLRDRLTNSINEFHEYRTSDAPNSTGLHLEYLKKSLSFVATAPVIGHGTGSIPQQFRKAAIGEGGASSSASDNPHNQFFAVAIQLGLVGGLVLVAMWIAHAFLFCAGGTAALVGMLVVVQSIVASLFNSYLFDFTTGWLYVFGVGVCGGMALRARAREPAAS